MNGFAIINKPSGISSGDAVFKCRYAMSKSLGRKIKCGHMGTLDPMASGILIVAFGNTTRLFDFLLNKEKIYKAKFVFGEETDTLDATGQVIGRARIPEYRHIVDFLPNLVGEIDQVPPKYSAVNINGRRAYDLARKGQDFEIKSKKVTIKSIDIVDKELDGYLCKSVTLTVVCGGGTYIRSICRDLAEGAGSVGYMSELIRTHSAGFSLEDAASIEEFTASPDKFLQNTENLLSKIMQVIELSDNQYKRIRNGLMTEIDNKDGIFGAKYDGKLSFVIKIEDKSAKSICFLED